MNAEIYFPREGKSFGQTSGKSFENTIKKLNEIDVNIIYKTEVNLNEKSIADALSVTESGDERIGMIFVADALSSDSYEQAKQFFESIGVVGKIKKAEAEGTDPEELNEPETSGQNPSSTEHITDNGVSLQTSIINIDDEYNGQNTNTDSKKQKRDKKRSKKDITDISLGEVTFEKEKCFAYYAEYNNKLIVLLPQPECIDTTFDILLYTTAYEIVNPQKKESFWKRFIPCAGDRPLDVVRKVILILAICTFVISSYMLINILVIEPAVNDKTTNGIKDLLVSSNEGETTPDGKSVRKPTDGSDGTLSDFSELLKANPDTVGWLTVKNTNIDYVVVKPSEDKDKEYYLYRDFYGNDSKYGTVFMDYRSTLDSKNLILHGHHMQDGRMFANLKMYEDFDFYKQTPTVTFNTIYEKSKWKIISVFKTNTLENQGDFLVFVGQAVQAGPLGRFGRHPFDTFGQGRKVDRPVGFPHPAGDRNAVNHAVQFRHGYGNGLLDGIEAFGVLPPILLRDEQRVRIQDGHAELLELRRVHAAAAREGKFHGIDQDIRYRFALMEKVLVEHVG